jgi:hypothetical protein
MGAPVTDVCRYVDTTLQGDAKGLEALEQFETLRKTGSVTKTLAARRKKDASKIRRHMPK